jgi:hypothetical protein
MNIRGFVGWRFEPLQTAFFNQNEVGFLNAGISAKITVKAATFGAVTIYNTTHITNDFVAHGFAKTTARGFSTFISGCRHFFYPLFGWSFAPGNDCAE